MLDQSGKAASLLYASRMRPSLLCPPFSGPVWSCLHAFVKHCSRNDLRHRFGSASDFRDLSVLKSVFDIPPGLGELALVWDRCDAIAAVLHRVRISAAEAELALLVRADLKRKGLGTLLLEDAISRSAQHDMTTLVGHVLRENTPMLRLARKLGFTSRDSSPLSLEMVIQPATLEKHHESVDVRRSIARMTAIMSSPCRSSDSVSP